MQYPEHQNSNANEGKSYENTHSSLYLVLFLFVVLFVGAGFLGFVITTSDSSESRQELSDLAPGSDSELEEKSLKGIDTKVVDTAISSLEFWSK